MNILFVVLCTPFDNIWCCRKHTSYTLAAITQSLWPTPLSFDCGKLLPSKHLSHSNAVEHTQIELATLEWGNTKKEQASTIDAPKSQATGGCGEREKYQQQQRLLRLCLGARGRKLGEIGGKPDDNRRLRTWYGSCSRNRIYHNAAKKSLSISCRLQLSYGSSIVWRTVFSFSVSNVLSWTRLRANRRTITS